MRLSQTNSNHHRPQFSFSFYLHTAQTAENGNNFEKEPTCDNESNLLLISSDLKSEKPVQNVSFTLPDKSTSTVYTSTLTQPKTIKGKSIKSRTVLWWLAFVGFAINYMIRINLNIAIVDMVAPKQSNEASGTSVCLNERVTLTVLNTTNYSEPTIVSGWKISSLERKLLKNLNVSNKETRIRFVGFSI